MWIDKPLFQFAFELFPHRIIKRATLSEHLF